MKAFILIFLSILLFTSCQSKLSDKDQAIIEVLKQDLTVKERLAYDYCTYLQGYIDEHPAKPLPLKFYYIQRNLIGYYDSLGMNIPNEAAIDSLENAFIKSYRYEVEMPEKLSRKIASDSLEFYLLKSRYLSHILDLQWQLLAKMPNEGFRFKKSNLDVLFNLAANDYKVSDTLEAIISPVYHNFDYVIKSCKLFKNGRLVAKPDIISHKLQYGPLEKGVYTIKIVMQRINETYFNDLLVLERRFDFVVE